MSGAVKLALLALVVILLAVGPADLTSIGLPWPGFKRYGTYILTLWLVTSIAAMGVNLIVGYAGLETLAQAAFLGIGAYTSALLQQAGLPFGANIMIAGALCFAAGILLGFPALRVQKHYLAFVTLSFTVFVWLVLRNEEWLTGGVEGIRNIKRPEFLGISLRPPLYYYWLVLAITTVLTGLLWWLLRSPWGRAFTALRENAVRAESLGVDVRTYTLLAFAIGSAYGGMAGAIYAPLVEFIDPSPFALGPSLMFMLMVVVGGLGTFVGPFVGAAVAVLLPEWLRFAESYYLIIFASLVMLMTAFFPSGLVGVVTKLARQRTEDATP